MSEASAVLTSAPQAAYGPGQPTSLVFAPPPPPQMSSAPQPRQVRAPPSSGAGLCSAVRFPPDVCFKALSLSHVSSATFSPSFPAVLPVCCRASYVTPTGTNSPLLTSLV